MNIKNYLLKLTVASLILIVSACTPQEVGGPCEYVDFEDEAVVTLVEKELTVLKGAARTYEVSNRLFDSSPKENERFIVKGKVITEGSCNPLNVVDVIAK